MKKLPIGIQSFKNIRTEGYYYADKTLQLCQLVNHGKYYFLSRPQGFGKSLFLSTLKSAFSGEKDLFKGLYLENHWNWDIQYPVISIPISQGIGTILKENSNKYEIVLENKTLKSQFAEIIKKLHDKYQEKVVILVDDYDKPIFDNLKSKRISAIKEEFKKFYAVIKDNDEYIRFAFLTGVSKLSNIPFFQDISLDKRYGEICGYTETEIKTIFNDYLKVRDFEQLKKWYSAYNFLGEKVYNPFYVLSYLESSEFKTFEFANLDLLKLFCKKNKEYLVANLESIEVSDSFFDTQECFETLLFQMGYLTIKEKQTLGVRNFYKLSYPNLQVSMSLTENILNYFTKNSLEKDNLMLALYQALQAADVGALKDIFQGFFRINKPNKSASYYISIVYCYFVALGLEIIIENIESNSGKFDFTVKLDDKVFIIEFKLIDNNSYTPLEEIKEKQYFKKYKPETEEIYLIGITFNQAEGEIINFQGEKLYVILNKRNREENGENRYLFEPCTNTVNCKNALLIS